MKHTVKIFFAIIIFFTLKVPIAHSIPLLIDIQPRDFPNGINPRSQGTISVAILTNAGFYAPRIDPQTVRFGKTGIEAPAVYAALEDVDRDGDVDLILHFKIQDTGIQCRDKWASLTGHTTKGQAMRGSDSLVTVGCM
jgi:hypothetical protein